MIYDSLETELPEQGIHPGTIRLSIGTEYIDDLLEDLAMAFKAAGLFSGLIHIRDTTRYSYTPDSL